MTVLFTTFVTMLLGFSIHVMVWRIRRPRRSALVLFFIFVGSLAGVALLLSTGLLEAGIWAHGWVELTYVALAHISMTLAYLLCLSAIEAESPSSLIVLGIQASGTRGLSFAELSSVITDDLFVLNRLNGLLTQNMIEERNGRYFITGAGVKYMDFFLLYRRFMQHLPKGG